MLKISVQIVLLGAVGERGEHHPAPPPMSGPRKTYFMGIRDGETGDQDGGGLPDPWTMITVPLL